VNGVLTMTPIVNKLLHSRNKCNTFVKGLMGGTVQFKTVQEPSIEYVSTCLSCSVLIVHNGSLGTKKHLIRLMGVPPGLFPQLLWYS
jgi:hypothetical protein